MIFRALAALGCALLLSGCLADESKCRGYGFEQGTPQFSQCLMQVDMQRRGAALAIAGAQMQAQSQPPPAPSPPPAPLICTPAYGGRTICQ